MVRRFKSADGSLIRCGESASENEALVRGSSQKDLWFHLDGQPSAHVLLSVVGKSALRENIADALQVVKYFSARSAGSSRVIFVSAKAVSGKETKEGTVTLKKAPEKRTVVYDEGTMDRLLATKH
eukprot:Plantae.Rhodophyta-Palmaria_palmata.ctg25935.p1 GENE.Plantae.Rhodophyta-Palmaria_palmata.ctg25935~~Plantae.Rhodophyta-Palmaria_palmata.ctg25935.p1  ORF type:complete len:125 (+),score=20.38 Plantae.Rhodophyta-Palmaria_palmata.ctg25935:114-488(+)